MAGAFHVCLNKNLRSFSYKHYPLMKQWVTMFAPWPSQKSLRKHRVSIIGNHSLWSGAVNLEYWTLKMCWVTASGVYQWKGKPVDPQHCAFCLMVVIGRVLHNFGLFVIQKLHSIIIQFKTSSELVAIGRNHWRKADAVKINLPRLGNRSFDK